jgi:HlyD family secretion protein
MNRKRILVVILAVAVLLGVVGGYAYASGGLLPGASAAAQSSAQATEIPQAQARLGSLTVSTNGTGQLVPVSEVSIGFKQAGVLTELDVSEGDQVKAGDVLARLQVDQTPAQLADALATAKLNVVNAQQALDQLYTDAEVNTAQALLAFEQAQANLADVQDISLTVAEAQQAQAAAQKAVQDAQTQLAILNARPSQQAIDVAHSSLLFKEKDLAALDKKITNLENQVKTAPSQMKDRMRQQLRTLRVQYITQKADYEKRLAAYNSMGTSTVDPDELALAQARLVTAQAQLAQVGKDLATAQAGPPAGDLAQAQVQLDQAQAKYETLKDGPDPLAVAKAQATLAAAQAGLALAQNDTSLVDLVSPIDGVVVAVDAQQDARIDAGNFLTIDDVSENLIDIYVDQADLSMVKVGNRVSVVFDALPDQTYLGQIIQVDPSVEGLNASAQQSAGEFGPPQVSDTAGSIHAVARLDSAPVLAPGFLALGLNASVDIIDGQVENAVIIPVAALYTLSSGEYVVYVVNGSQVEQRTVTVGLQDYTSAQITSGLSAGEAVALEQPTTTTEGNQ